MGRTSASIPFRAKPQTGHTSVYFFPTNLLRSTSIPNYKRSNRSKWWIRAFSPAAAAAAALALPAVPPPSSAPSSSRAGTPGGACCWPPRRNYSTLNVWHCIPHLLLCRSVARSWQEIQDYNSTSKLRLAVHLQDKRATQYISSHSHASLTFHVHAAVH